MTRFALTAAVVALLGLPAHAKSDQDKLCEEMAKVTQELADLRLSGSDENDAKAAVLAKMDSDEAGKMQLVPTLSAWVYSLQKADLNSDVEAAFAEQCKGYKG